MLHVISTDNFFLFFFCWTLFDEFVDIETEFAWGIDYTFMLLLLLLSLR
jgi:hypothetical protein